MLSLAWFAMPRGTGAVPLIMAGTGGVIGAGTTLALTRYASSPTLAQSAWFANVVAWGTLAGAVTATGTEPYVEGDTRLRLRWGLIAAGETVGIAGGIWSARSWDWSAEQAVLADSMVIGASLGFVGVQRLRGKSAAADLVAAVGVTPAMVLSAMVARKVDPTSDDLHLIGMGALTASWTGGLLAAGAAEESFAFGTKSQGGLIAGLGFGYLGATAAAAFVDLPPSRVYASSGGLLAGNALGLGLHMAIRPDDDHWTLGAGLGGLALAGATFAAFPYLDPGERAPSMTTAGALYGAGVYAAAWGAGQGQRAATDSELTRLEGAMLAGGVAGGLAGLVSSGKFSPDGTDQLTAAAGLGLGMGAGLGTAQLFFDGPGLADELGVLTGAAAGFATGAITAHRGGLRGAAVGAGAAGMGYGALWGTLSPTLGSPDWQYGRKTSGGSLMGASLGALGATAAAQLADASPGQVGAFSTAGLFGLAGGLGAGLMAPDASSRSMRIGTVAGSAGMIAAAMVAEPWARLEDGPGPGGLALGTMGALLGPAYGVMLAGAIDPSGSIELTPGQQKIGGALLGLSAGTATGLVLSRRFDPDAGDAAFATSVSVLGGALGSGIPMLAFDQAGRADTIGLLAGAIGGLAGGAAAGPRLRAADYGAGTAGMAYGALIGALSPSLGSADWDGGRRGLGGALTGVSLGAAAGAMTAHFTGASGPQVWAPTIAGTLGLGMGAGAGLLWPDDSTRALRIGTVAGASSALVGSIALEPWARFSEGPGPGAPGLVTTGAIAGPAYGLMFAALADPSGRLGSDASRGALGGALLGLSGGVTAGLALSRAIDPEPGDHLIALGASALGGTAGLGAAMVGFEPGRSDPGLMLGGSLAGLAAGAVVQHVAPLGGTDALAAPVGAGYGALLGTLAPSLGADRFAGFDRRGTGGALLGLSAGALSAVALRHASGAEASSVGLATLGGADGLATGWALGYLVENGGDRGERLGVVAGTVAGLGIGMAAWPHVRIGEGDPGYIGAGSGVGGWVGLWLPALGHERLADFPGRRMAAGAVAGAGLGTFATSLSAPWVEADGDLVSDGLLLNTTFSAAGLGAGLLLSERDDLPVGIMLGSGTVGMVLGAALHSRIHLGDDDQPLLTLAGLEGVWLGGWLPFAMYGAEGANGRRVAGGLAAGTLGGLGLAAVTSPVLKLTGRQAGIASLGSAIGASIGGGISLGSEVGPQKATSYMLGGTGAGLVVGVLVAPNLDWGEHGARDAALGGLLGASEALAFAWASGGAGTNQYAGAALVGAGLGTSLGLAAAASPRFTATYVPASAGFAAWGAWTGSFSGALAGSGAHSVTLGGLIGANGGFALGAGLLHLDILQPSDFGWVSLAAGAGTVLGAGAGAVAVGLTNSDSSKPIFAGLALGPVVGMIGGAIALPKLRTLGGPREKSEGSKLAPELGALDGFAPLRAIQRVIGFSECQPIFGAVPPPPGLVGGIHADDFSLMAGVTGRMR